MFSIINRAGVDSKSTALGIPRQAVGNASGFMIKLYTVYLEWLWLANYINSNIFFNWESLVLSLIVYSFILTLF